MLHRVLEPEVMDSPDEARDYDAMDHADVNRRFVDDFLAARTLTSCSGEVLDLGTGTAQIPIRLCAVDADVRIVAVDLAEGMLDLARRNIAASDYGDRIRIEHADAKRLAYDEGRFAAVISNSIVHHIPKPLDVLAESLRVASRGGLLFIRDLLRPDDDAGVARLVDTYAARANPHQRQLFEASLRAALGLEEIRSLVQLLDYDPSSVCPTSDRHWTWSAVKR